MGVYLSQPITEKKSSDGGSTTDDEFMYGLTAMQGWRQTMEDAHLVKAKFSTKELEHLKGLFGVFDGHGGSSVSAWASKELTRIFETKIKQRKALRQEKLSSGNLNHDIVLVADCLEDTFLGIDEELYTKEIQEELKQLFESTTKVKPKPYEEASCRRIEEQYLRNIFGCFDAREYQSTKVNEDSKIEPIVEDSDNQKKANKSQFSSETPLIYVSTGNILAEDIISNLTDHQYVYENESENVIEDLDAIDNSSNNEISEPLPTSNESSAVVKPVASSNEMENNHVKTENEKSKLDHQCDSILTEDSIKSNYGSTSSDSIDMVQDSKQELPTDDYDDYSDENLSSYNSLYSDSLESTDDIPPACTVDEDENLGPVLPYNPVYCGSTGIVCVVIGTDRPYLITANAGDSRAVLCRGETAYALSNDHKPSLTTEFKRITEAGGYISNGRVDGNLNLTRALGDLYYKSNSSLLPSQQKITAHPEITIVPLCPEDKFIILACDGIWDCLENQQAVDFVLNMMNNSENVKLSQICEQMCDKCISKNPIEYNGGVGCDNMTVMIVRLVEHVKNSKHPVVENKDEIVKVFDAEYRKKLLEMCNENKVDVVTESNPRTASKSETNADVKMENILHSKFEEHDEVKHRKLLSNDEYDSLISQKNKDVSHHLENASEVGLITNSVPNVVYEN